MLVHLGMTKSPVLAVGTRQTGCQSREMAAERRVCFVAITRTRKTLTLTYPLEIAGCRKGPSRFLAEMGVARQTVR